MDRAMREVLRASGPTGHDLLAVDWRATPLGDPDRWSASLRTTVRTVLSSGFPMWLGWGEALTFLCNDACRPVLGERYPGALGRPAREVWSDAWSDLGPRVDQVVATGEATWDEGLLLLLQRGGHVEETYHTFSCSPLTDDDAAVTGVLCVANEVTEQVVADRRTATLRDLGTRTRAPRTEASAVATACERLAGNRRCLPFAAVYLFDEDGARAHRRGSVGLEPGHPAAPAVVEVGAPSAAWPLAAAREGRGGLVDAVEERFGDLPTGGWSAPPRQAYVVPLAQPAQREPYGALVVGLNPHRPFDEAYRTFLGLVAGHLSAAIEDARLIEQVGAELDRAQRLRSALEHSTALLDRAQRLARLGSWEIDLADQGLVGSATFLEMTGLTAEDLRGRSSAEVMADLVHPDDLPAVLERLAAAAGGETVELELRIVRPSGEVRLFHAYGEPATGPDGARLLRGSFQDVTEQRALQEQQVAAEAEREVTDRERRIAQDLQASLLPRTDPHVPAFDVATHYRAGVVGTEVGGDWYDVIDLGAGRTAVVIGDVMGRGVRAAAVMGQLRAATRAFAKLDLGCTDVLEQLDPLVHDLAGDQIVTCVYAVVDAADLRLTYANAGHLPPLLARAAGGVEPLAEVGPPLGAGYYGQQPATVDLEPGDVLLLYTDGLVERRGEDLQDGLARLAAALGSRSGLPVGELVGEVVEAVGGHEVDDDVAMVVARARKEDDETVVRLRVGADPTAVQRVRRVVAREVARWGAPQERVDDAVLVASELVTNALLHARPPVDVQVRRMGDAVLLEVRDTALLRPRRRHAGEGEEDGRGLAIVGVLARDWGTRSSPDGKTVWAVLDWPPARP